MSLFCKLRKASFTLVSCHFRSCTAVYTSNLAADLDSVTDSKVNLKLVPSSVTFRTAQNVYMQNVKQGYFKSPYKKLSSDFGDTTRGMDKNQRLWYDIIQQFDDYGPVTKFKILKQNVMEALRKTDISQHLGLCEAVLFSNNPHLKVCFMVMFMYHLTQRDLVNSFTPDEIARLMFFVYFYGDAPDVYLSIIEEYLHDNIENFTLNQIGSVSMGFFHTNKTVRFDLAQKIADKLLQNTHEISINNFISVIKCLRHSKYNMREFYNKLALKICETPLNTFNISQLMNIMFTYAAFRIYQPKLLDYCADVITHNLYVDDRRMRTKDIARIVWSFGTFAYDRKEIYTILLSMFRETYANAYHSKNFPGSVADVCVGCAYVNIYPHDLLDILFSEDTIIKLRDATAAREKRYSMVMLHHSVELECPDYTGNRINKDVYPSLLDPSSTVKTESLRRQGLNSCFMALQSVVGQDYVRCHFILPHFNMADIEMRVNKDGSLQPINNEYVLTGPIDRRIAVVVLGHNQCAVYSPYILGHSRTKIRQLEHLGYTVVPPYVSQTAEVCTAGWSVETGDYRLGRESQDVALEYLQSACRFNQIFRHAQPAPCFQYSDFKNEEHRSQEQTPLERQLVFLLDELGMTPELPPITSL